MLLRVKVWNEGLVGEGAWSPLGRLADQLYLIYVLKLQVIAWAGRVEGRRI